METNTNFFSREALKNTEDKFGQVLRTVYILGLIIFPWIVAPSFSKSLELPREVFLFNFSGLLLVSYFLYCLKRGEFIWHRTKLNWILGVWTVLFSLLFLYAKNFKIAWDGYPGSFTGGFSEHLAFFVLFFLGIQLFNELEWKRVLQYILTSLTAVIVFFILLTIYFQNNNILTLDFARTPSLVTAASGVVALSLWWILKRTETQKKSHTFLMVLILFFVSSLLDFHLSWWMWVAGVGVILILDFITRLEVYRKERDTRTLGINKENNGVFALLFHGDSKYLLLVLLFALSRSMSPLFLGEQKIIFMPYFSYLQEYPLLGQKVFFYLLLNLIVFCFGFFYFWKNKKERNSIMLVLAGLISISLGHILYYSESVIFFLLNWVLLVYAGLTFLRKAPEKDYLVYLKTDTKARKLFFILGAVLSIVVLGLVFMKIGILF